MTINQAVCASFKKQLLEGDHDIDNDTINLALYTSSVTLNGNTTAYSATNEVGASGTYAAGGITLTSPTIGLTASSATASTAFVDFANASFTSATISAQAALIYNRSSSATNAAIAVLDFGAVKTSTNGTFTIAFPTNDASSAILRLS
jgi:hypothetical protein|tara:strand:+ start:285 stop:728 length:444 start_codon:yes stop_codon:yes gene_type:complete